MPTSSFDKRFIVVDKDSVKRFLEAMENPVQKEFMERDLKSENEKGLKILSRKFNKTHPN